ncbi:MAG: hypothetical protein ACFFG0_06140 [Candidatus Thorarchaeota archaeon]
MSEKIIKIGLKLDQVIKNAIDIIAKAFNWTPEQFLQYSIKRDVEYVMQFAGLEDSYSGDLKEHYELKKIDMKELLKLTSLMESFLEGVEKKGEEEVDNQNEEMFKTLFEIETKDYPKDVIDFMNKKNISFKAWKIHELKEDLAEIDEELPFVELNPELYQKVKKLSEITGISMEDIVSKELDDFLFSVGDQIAIFLDRHLGIENIKNPIEMIRNLKELLHIPKRYIEALKNKEELLKEIEAFKI